MLLYAAALAVMFICQNGLTGVIQAPPRRPRAPRKAASRGPLKTYAPNPLGSITITSSTTPARPTRWLLVALASLARAGHDSEETYVIQALLVPVDARDDRAVRRLGHVVAEVLPRLTSSSRAPPIVPSSGLTIRHL